MPFSKEIKWKDRGRPITWQGWTFTIFYFISIIFFGYYAPIFINEYDIFFPLIFGFSLLPYMVVVRLTTDTDDNPSGITSAEISRMLKEKRKNRINNQIKYNFFYLT